MKVYLELAPFGSKCEGTRAEVASKYLLIHDCTQYILTCCGFTSKRLIVSMKEEMEASLKTNC